METPEITPYPLPPFVVEAVSSLARRSEILLIGEMHGTQEVPRLLLGLLGELTPLGYGALAFEIDHEQHGALMRWAEGTDADPPRFFTQPCGDGRGNAQTLALIREAVRRGWRVFCFDIGQDETFEPWTERDARMARHFAAQREPLGAGMKVLGVCGNLHSRVTQTPGDMAVYWPSLAAQLQSLYPEAGVHSIGVWFRRGTYFNGGKVNELWEQTGPDEPTVRDDGASHHTLDLHLPEAHAATFLSPPVPPAGA